MTATTTISLLQCGRDAVVAENSRTTRSGSPASRCFNAAATLSSRRISPVRCGTTANNLLQCGRDAVVAEK